MIRSEVPFAIRRTLRETTGRVEWFILRRCSVGQDRPKVWWFDTGDEAIAAFAAGGEK